MRKLVPFRFLCTFIIPPSTSHREVSPTTRKSLWNCQHDLYNRNLNAIDDITLPQSSSSLLPHMTQVPDQHRVRVAELVFNQVRPTPVCTAQYTVLLAANRICKDVFDIDKQTAYNSKRCIEQ